MTVIEHTPARGIRIFVAMLLGSVLGGCATVQPEASFPQVQSAVANNLGQKIEWNRDGKRDQWAQQATRTLLREKLSAEAALQIALLNNRRLQARFEELGIAQADLVEAGLLENPVLSAGALFKDAGTEIDLDIVQNFLGVFTLSARKKIGRAAAEQVTLEVSRDVLDFASEVQAQ